MEPVSYRCHRFPPEIIQNAVWLYCRFTLSFRDGENLLADRGLDDSYETVRRWVLKFGQDYARQLRRFRPRSDDRWQLDETFVTIRGRRMYLWRAVDAEGEVLDFLIQSKRNKRAALKLMRKLLKRQGISPAAIVTDKLPSYRAALRELDLSGRHETGGRKNNRAENSHQPIRRRERKMQRFKSAGSSAEIQECDTLNMNFALISRAALAKTNFLSEQFTHAKADFDFGLRLRRLGGRIILAPGYSGNCLINSRRGTSNEANLAFVERWHRITSIKEEPPGDRAVFCRRHAGFFWPLVWILPYARICVSSFISKLKWFMSRDTYLS